MKRTKINFDGLSVNTSQLDKLTRAQRFWLWITAIIGATIVLTVKVAGIMALPFFGVLALLAVILVLTLDGRKKDEERWDKMYR